MCRSSLARVSASIDSSRYSLSSCRKSLHVSKGVVSLAFEETRQLLAQLQAGPQQPAFHGRHGKAKHVRSLLGGKLVDVAQHENRAVRRLKALNRRIQNAAELLPRKELLGVLTPGCDFPH